MAGLNEFFKRFKYYFDIRGVDTEELPNAPTGWKDLVVSHDRSSTYNGLLRNITGQLAFMGKGAYLLRREYAKYRLMARINLRIDIDTREPYNTYENLYTGKLDFSKKIDSQDTFTVGAKSNDFSANVDAYDGQKYSISLEDGINLELTPLALNEQASIIIDPNTDHRSDAFFILEIVNNTQNSIDASVSNYAGQFVVVPSPDFTTDQHFFYHARTDCNVLFNNVSINGIAFYNGGSGSAVYSIQIVKSDGTIVRTLYQSHGVTETFSINTTFTVPVVKGDKLFLYFDTTDGDSNWGFRITNGVMNISYKTITPPTMCKALRGTQLFAKLLQAMNVNQDSGPNLPVDYQSYLLSGTLWPVVFTSSDSIRTAQGSIYLAGDTISDGIYQVVRETVTYNSIVYTLNQTFGHVTGFDTFTGTGAIQKIQSLYVGNVYNIGDSLQAGGTYLVEGDPGGNITYNAHVYNIGEFFKYVFGIDTFTGSDDSMFVKQVAIDPQIILSFNDFFQTIKGIQGGDAAFGCTPKPFIETLATVYKSGINSVSLGNLSKNWKSEPAVDLLYNTIKVGYEDQQYDAINGTQEVNSTQYYGSAMLDPVNELDLRCVVRADPYGIETVRVTQNDTAASRSDNDPFMIWIKDTPESETPFEYFHPLRTEGLVQPIIGVDASYYNYKLSPKTNLLRGTRYLASIFYGMVGYQLTLTGWQKNVGMVYVGLDGVRISEAEPVQIANLGKPYFLPEYVLDTMPTQSIDNDPYVDLNFNINGVNYRAFVSSYKVNLATDAPQEVKFLLSPNNNLLTTVR